MRNTLKSAQRAAAEPPFSKVVGRLSAVTLAKVEDSVEPKLDFLAKSHRSKESHPRAIVPPLAVS